MKELQDIIQKCIRRERQAQQQLYSYTYQKVSTAVAVYAKDNSERDWIFNLGMMRVFTSLESYKPLTNYLGWARTLLVRAAIDHYRSQKKHKDNLTAIEVQDYNVSSKDFEEMMLALEAEDIIKILQQLPEKERLVFSMNELDGYTHKEIQELAGINSNTSKWLLSKAKKSLKSMIENLKTPQRNGYGL